MGSSFTIWTTGLAAAVLPVLTLLPAPAFAETTGKDMAVASRALAFMEPKLAGQVTTVILYEPGDSDSEEDAKTIRAGLSTTDMKGVALRVKLAPASDLSSLAGAKVVFLANGVRNQAAIFGAASRQNAITLSTDMSCVKSGRCVVGVKAQPTVQIIVSRTARQASNIKFSQAFLMLVKEQ